MGLTFYTREGIFFIFFLIYLKIISFEIDSVYSNDKENLNIFRRRKEGNGYLEG